MCIRDSDNGYYRFFGYLNLFVFFMLMLVLANNYVLLFVGWEGVGLCSYLLIGFYFQKKSAGDAGKKAFIVNRVGDAGFILGMLLMFSILGTVRFLNVNEALRSCLLYTSVPQTLREGALALGASKWKTIATVVVPAAYRGIATGMILGVARIAGETAPLLFTSGNNAYMSSGFTQPTASLPVMIFLRATAPYDDWHRQAWAAGLVLLIGVLFANIAARLILSRGIAIQK